MTNSNKCAKIYELSTGRNCTIDMVQNEILNLLEQNYSIEELKLRYELNQIIDLFKILNKNKLGRFFRKKVYIDKIRPVNMKMVKQGKSSITNISRIGLELTGICNMACKFCSTEDIVYRKCGCKQWDSSYELSDEKWGDICDQVIKIGVREVIISGGEPLIRPNLIRLICQKFHQNSIKVRMFTNATLIEDETALFLKEYGVDLAIQVFSNNKNIYERITGSAGSYEKFVKGLEYVNKYKINAIGIMLVNKYNENELNVIGCNLFNLPLEVQFIYDNNEWHSTKFNDYIYSRNSYDVNVNLFNYQILMEYNNCLFGQLFISNEGILYPCMMLRDFPVGNIKEEPLWKIIQKNEYQEFWELSKAKIRQCSNCEKHLSCLDCRAIEYFATKQITGLKYCKKIAE